MGDWTVTIPDQSSADLALFGGYVPGYWLNSYSFYGNKNQFCSLVNIDLFDPNVLTAGGGQAALTAGTEAGAVTTLIAAILRHVTADNVSYACGGNLYHKISASAVTNAGGTYPHTIDKATVTGEDAVGIIYHKTITYVFYNHSGAAGDILKDNAGTIDDDWGSTVPTGAEALQSAPHPAINGGDDDAYFGNGRYIGVIRANGTLDAQGLDFWTDSVIPSLSWNLNRVLAAVVRPNIAGSNFNQSGVYTWNGIAASWEGDPIEVNGKIGALYTKNGVTFCWWQESGQSAYYNFGYLSNGRTEVIRQISGTMPGHYQVGEYKGYLAWIDSANGDVMMYGSSDSDISVRLFPYTRTKYSTHFGALSTTFGELLTASDNGTNYCLSKPSGLATTSTFSTKAFKVSGPGYLSIIDLIQVETETITTGTLDLTLYYNKGASNTACTQIATGQTVHRIFAGSEKLADFQLRGVFTPASGACPKVRSLMIKGHTVLNN
jgi:hypothetical protein